MKKRLVIEFVFDEVREFEDEDWTTLELRKIARVSTDLTEGQLDALGEGVAQTDQWQVDNWIAIQQVLSGVKKVKIRKR